MMNRIILIGNGFDLAHGLPTSYADFIQFHQPIPLTQLIQDDKLKIVNNLRGYVLPDLEHRKELNEKLHVLTDELRLLEKIAERIQELEPEHNSEFIEEINKEVETYNWVDIEAVYYRWLTRISKHEYVGPDKLNEELEIIKKYLTDYLNFIQENRISPKIVKDHILQIIYEPFRINDISISGQDQFKRFAENRWKEKNVSKQKINTQYKGLIAKQ